MKKLDISGKNRKLGRATSSHVTILCQWINIILHMLSSRGWTVRGKCQMWNMHAWKCNGKVQLSLLQAFQAKAARLANSTSGGSVTTVGGGSSSSSSSGNEGSMKQQQGRPAVSVPCQLHQVSLVAICTLRIVVREMSTFWDLHNYCTMFYILISESPFILSFKNLLCLWNAIKGLYVVVKISC